MRKAHAKIRLMQFLFVYFQFLPGHLFAFVSSLTFLRYCCRMHISVYVFYTHTHTRSLLFRAALAISALFLCFAAKLCQNSKRLECFLISSPLKSRLLSSSVARRLRAGRKNRSGDLRQPATTADKAQHATRYAQQATTDNGEATTDTQQRTTDANDWLKETERCEDKAKSWVCQLGQSVASCFCWAALGNR